MSRSFHKSKATRIAKIKPISKAADKALYKRATWGSTHRILRRNRKMWSRALGKARRNVDKQKVKEGLE